MTEAKKMKYSLKEESDNSNLKSIQLIESVQDELGGLQDEFEKDILRLEKKYEYQRKPIYAKREEAISHIPNFWLTALMNHRDISHVLNDADEEFLLYLMRLECDVEFENEKEISFKIVFHFRENPYFENKTLVKNYIETGVKEKQNIVVSSIDWKGQDTSEKLKEKKSFFCWLTTANYLTNDFEIALAIKEDVWVNPLHFFLISDEMAESGSDDDSDEDVVIINDSDEGKSPVEEPEFEEDESDNDSDYDDSALSSTEVPQSDN